MGKLVEQYNLDYNDRYLKENDELRRLWLNREIDDDSIDDIVYSIFRYNRMDKGVPVEERIPIVIYINTDGGSVNSGFSVIDSIINSETPVYTVNVGRCYSMGFLIFIAGHKRYALRNSTFLMHDGSTGAYFETTSKMIDRLDFETKDMEEHTKNHILNNTNITDTLYDEKLRCEWYFYPEEAKKYGVVDEIVGVDCDINSIL